MLIKRIRLTNLLSFGPDTEELELEPLNVLIGPNGSGKSNFIEAMGLLQATPRDLMAPIVASGGIYNWIWRGEPKASPACIETVIDYPQADHPKARTLKYRLGFTEKGQRFELTDEWIGNESSHDTYSKPYMYYELQGARAVLNYKDGTQRQLQPEEFDPEQSILAQRRDPDHYPELTWLGQAFDGMRLYRDWSFGRQTPPLVCIEEPELGLHPDILPGLADLIRDASERCQLIVTTHSEVLVDKLTETPESVVVCEKHAGKTEMQRLDRDELSDWLKKYSLGDLWTKGGLGGTRW